jgi:hypothetical protein
VNFRAAMDELVKLGAVSDVQAEAALERLDSLEKNKPSVGQMLGSGAGVASKALGTMVEHGGAPSFAGRLAPRALLAAGLTGGLMAGATPVIRAGLDRHREIGTLKKFLAEPPQAVGPAGVDTSPEVPPKTEI